MLVVVAGFFLCVCTIPHASAEGPSEPIPLAVLEFSLNLNVANPDSTAYDRLPSQLASENLLRLAAESERYVVADGRGAVTDQPCADTACALRMGRGLGVQRVLWGRITKVSALIWFVSAHLVEVPTGTTLHAETLQFRGNMRDVVPRLAAILWRRMHEGN